MKLVSIILILLGCQIALASKPNVIFILADDLSAKELSLYGGEIETPVLDRLASGGVVFETAWSTPLCGPTRAMIHTGKYPHNQGYYENSITPNVIFTRDSEHLPLLRMIQQAGYKTGMFGKVHHWDSPKKYGADYSCMARYWKGYDGPDQRFGSEPLTNRNGMYGVSWYWHPALIVNGVGLPTTEDDFGPDIEAEHIIRFIRENRDESFFAYWPTNLPHMAHRSGLPANQGWHFPDVPELDADGNRTGGRVAGSLESNTVYLDHLIGKIRDEVESLGLLENTVFVYVGDNGTPGYGKGKYHNEVALRVPFVWSGGPVEALGRSSVLVDLTDLWPTFADLVGFKGEPNTDGHSFANYLLGKPFEPREYIQMEMLNARWLRDQNWLLDGYGRFWDCCHGANESNFKDVTESKDPVVIEARKRFEKRLKQIPLPDFDNPKTKASWDRFLSNGNLVKVYRPDYLEY